MVGNSSFKVGLYIRLSRDDGNIESDSIVSQRSLLNQYVKENNYIVVDEYVDDGFSGTNFDRPSFKRMMKDIELGKINMIITKDMSRLGRDYIGTGELIEKFFPNNNIRYIAINDGIDTFIDNTNNDIQNNIDTTNNVSTINNNSSDIMENNIPSTIDTVVEEPVVQEVNSINTQGINMESSIQNTPDNISDVNNNV